MNTSFSVTIDKLKYSAFIVVALNGANWYNHSAIETIDTDLLLDIGNSELYFGGYFATGDSYGSYYIGFNNEKIVYINSFANGVVRGGTAKIYGIKR